MLKGAGTSGGGTELKQETPQWRLRDTLAAALLFLGSAAWVFWQNTRVAVLWDLGYLLDTSWRIALGQMPYRDFPLVHAPATFLIQAALIKLFGRHYLVPVLYAAVMSGLGSVLAWRIILRVLRGAWSTSLLLTTPLVVTGIYAIYPHPIYDCDCALAVLLAVWLLMRAENTQSWRAPFCAGAACVLPLFCKQNVGLPFLAAIAAGAAIIVATRIRREALKGRTEVLKGHDFSRADSRSKISMALATEGWFEGLSILAGIVAALLAASAAIALTAGLHNYLHWTVQFAAQRRMPGLASMLSIYAQPSFAWTVPVTAAGLALCHTRAAKSAWGRATAIALIAAPLAWTLINLFLQDDADDRADQLLSLWPLWMLAALAVAIVSLRRGISLRTLTPFLILAAIHGTMLSQQLWGSTYALWPLFLILIAFVLADLPRQIVIATATTISITFAICGGLYSASLERLNYIDIPDAPLQQAQTPALHSLATPGPYLPNLDELIAFTDREIPRGDALVLFPGEDPFYYATGRVPQFPVTLFDPATDPYSPAQLLAEARHHNVRWVIVKRVLQSKENVMPGFGETMQQVRQDFALDRRLAGYDIYRRK